MNPNKAIDEIKKYSCGNNASGLPPSNALGDKDTKPISFDTFNGVLFSPKPKSYTAARKTAPNFLNNNNNPIQSNMMISEGDLKGNALPKRHSLCIKSAPTNPLTRRLPVLLCRKRCRSSSKHSSELSIGKDHNNDDENGEKCFVCHWVFPGEMISAEREAHVNKCLDGEGEEHKKNYLKSHQQAKKDNDIYRSEQDKSVCPFCFTKVVSNIDRHIEKCIRKIKK